MTTTPGASLNMAAGLDTPKVAGLLVAGAVAILALSRRAFGGVRVSLGD